jgi:hypothetical protein
MQETSKLRGCEQALYPRKNWSSCFLINCGHPANAACTLEMLNQAGPFCRTASPHALVDPHTAIQKL